MAAAVQEAPTLAAHGLEVPDGAVVVTRSRVPLQLTHPAVCCCTCTSQQGKETTASKIRYIGYDTECITYAKMTTVSQSPVLTLGGICVSSIINFLQYLVTGSTFTVAEPFQLPAPQSGTLSRILSGTLPSAQTLSDVRLRRICLLDTSAFNALEVLDDYCAIYIYLFTYLLTRGHAHLFRTTNSTQTPAAVTASNSGVFLVDCAFSARSVT